VFRFVFSRRTPASAAKGHHGSLADQGSTDADLLIELMEIAPQQSDLLLEITNVRPLG
jgi:hypothetical protein